MEKVEKVSSQDSEHMVTDFSRLPKALRRSAAMQKYASAVKLYAESDLPLRKVAEQCGVSPKGLGYHIGTYHRELLFARYGLKADNDVLPAIKVKAPRGQSQLTHLKYKEAIEACGDIAYIEFNVSQVARMFGLSGPALASQLRVHYPDVIPAREALRMRLGLADNTHRGARACSTEAYATAVEMYRDSDKPLREVAQECKVSYSGLKQYLRFYHKDIVAAKAERRNGAIRKDGERTAGQPAGNGNVYGPKPESVAKYARAIELYCTSAMTIREIAASTGVPFGGLKGYIHQWHRGKKFNNKAASNA